MPLDPAIVQTINTSREADKIVYAAQTLAAASDPESHALLESRLKTTTFLDELDPPGKPVASRLDMKLWKPLRTLSENKAPSAKAVLESLTDSPLYVQNINRADLLLEASITLRPPGPRIVRFWTSFTSTNNPHAAVVQRVLLDNGSEEALRLFGNMMADESFSQARRENWLMSRLPRYRNEVPYLAMVKRFVELKSASREVRLAAVQSVFDWEDEWGPLHGPDVQQPPPRALAKRPARDLTREIARSARADLSVPKELDAKIGAVLKELDVLDSKPERQP